jgi:hypothetical protein
VFLELTKNDSDSSSSVVSNASPSSVSRLEVYRLDTKPTLNIKIPSRLGISWSESS